MKEVQQLVESQPLHCPSCSGLLCTVTPTGSTMAVPGTYYGDDCDYIPHVPERLGALSCGALACVGSCPHCAKRYWCLDVLLHEYADDEAALVNMLSDDPAWDSSFIISGHSWPWTAHAVTTDFGSGYVHSIGPIGVTDDAVTHGKNGVGVSACGGGGFWQGALATFIALQPKLEAVQRALAETVKTARAEANTGGDAPNLSRHASAFALVFSLSLQRYAHENTDDC